MIVEKYGRGKLRITIGDTLYNLRFVYPREILLPEEGYWQLLKASYHTHRFHKPLKVKKENQRARWKEIGFFNTPMDAKSFLGGEEVQPISYKQLSKTHFKKYGNEIQYRSNR